jgi:hypothetical protein
MIKVRIKKLPQARTGYQVQGALVNDVPAMGGADYNAYIGKPKLRESKYITAVPREEANLEAEGGETVYGDINGDGFPEHKIIKGPRHHSGGVPLNLPDDTFIFSDTRGMTIKDPEILEMFGKVGTKTAYTPAALAKQYDIQKYRKILEDPESDHLDRKTAELMIKKFVIKLGCLALAQEAKKGFPQGIPAVAKPCMEAKGINEEDVTPNKEVIALTNQIKSKYKLDENAEETMESEEQSDDVAAAEQINQGQPVAQPQEQQMQQLPPEEMMMYGGDYRRLRRAEEGMEQQMMEQPQEEGGDDMMQIVQEVSAALEQGADPQEVVVSLLQNELPPEAIVEIFMQLGASEEEAVGLIQEVIQELEGGGQEQMMSEEGQPMSEEEAMMMQQQQQAPPMAMYGMSMGGYDMPFYDEPEYDEEDIPEAEYGMAMGSGMSQNYQGRPKPIPGSGPMFPLPKADDGKIIKRSDYPDEAAFEKALFTADLERQSGTLKGPIQVIDASGKTRTFKGFKKEAAEGYGSIDINTFGGDTDAAKRAAAQYYIVSESLKDNNVRQQIINNTKAALLNEKHFRGKGATSASTNWTDRGYAMPTDDELVNNFLQGQERNLKIQGHGVDPEMFNDRGNGFRSWNDFKSQVINGTGKKVINPATGTPITNKAEFTAYQKYLATNFGGSLDPRTGTPYLSLMQVSDKIGEPFENDTKTRALQQATFHGYALTMENYDSYDADTKYALRNLRGDLQRGVDDETSMSPLFPKQKGIRISPIDDFFAPNKSTTGNTTSGHLTGAIRNTVEYEPDVNNPPCQCDDETKPDYGRWDEAQKKCNPELCKQPTPEQKKCPCVIVDEKTGEKTTIEQNPDPTTGECPPCEQEEDLEIEGPPAEWWLQDTIKTTGAFGDLMGVKKYMPWAPAVELQKPRPTFLDPTRELAANAEQANIQTQGMAQFAGPQALSARSSSVQGQAAKNAADVLSKYNNANVNIANQFELKGTDIANQESMLKQATAQRLYDQNTVANQQFDNSKLAMRNNLRNYYTNAITNKWQTDALNQMYPNYAVRPGVGGRMEFKPGDRQVTGKGAGTGMTQAEAYRQCRQMNPSATDQTSCVKNLMGSQGGTTASSGANANVGMGMYGTQRKQKKGGQSNGYLYLDSWLPFLM